MKFTTVASALALVFAFLPAMPANAQQMDHSKMSHAQHSAAAPSANDNGTTKVIPMHNKVCPVSQEPIGKDGGKKVVYEGYQISLCCPDCVETFNKNPEKYLHYLLDLKKKEKEDGQNKQVTYATAARPVGNANCPVSGHTVGSMQKGAHVDYNGYQVGLCCNGCTGRFNKNAEKNLQEALTDAKSR